jgi:hypothetical protein
MSLAAAAKAPGSRLPLATAKGHVHDTLQVVFPELQKRQMVRARKRRLRTSVLKSLASSASPFGSLLLPSGDINDEVTLTRWCHPHAAVTRCCHGQGPSAMG